MSLTSVRREIQNLRIFDVSKKENPELCIFNVSETRGTDLRSLDVSKKTKLRIVTASIKGDPAVRIVHVTQ